MTGRMRSMWDRIFECPIPVNRISALVVSSAPWWAIPPPSRPQEAISQDENKPGGLPVDIGTLTKPPPSQYLDYRGRRSLFHIVIGYSHRREHNHKKYSPGSAAALRAKEKRGSAVYSAVLQHRTKRGYSTWFCLRRDGALFTINNDQMKKKLRNLDKSYLEDIEKEKASFGASDEWLRLMAVPAAASPCAKNNIMASK